MWDFHEEREGTSYHLLSDSIHPLEHVCGERLKSRTRVWQSEESDIQRGGFLLKNVLGINTLTSYIKVTLNSVSLLPVCFNSISLKKQQHRTKQNKTPMLSWHHQSISQGFKIETSSLHATVKSKGAPYLNSPISYGLGMKCNANLI